jgi:FMN-dependent NADH-azoreductase
MKTILQINTSIHCREGQSTRLADELVAHLRGSDPRAELVKRDLAAMPVPHLDAEHFAAFMAKSEERDARQRALVALSDKLIGELRQADVIVLGLPMYNFGVPSQLKAYFDHVARAGETFRYTEQGPVGLLAGKKAYVVATRGGRYAGTPLDTQTAYVRDFLRFIGIGQVEFIYAEGLATGERNRNAAIREARASIENIVQANHAQAA